jgi:cobalamin-dependent methionine synthase I
VETAEALAELHHKKMREELGIANEDSAEIGFLLEPEQSTSAIVVHHPGAKYFVV